MIALVLATAVAPDLIDPSVVDLLVARPEWSDSYPSFARAFSEYGDESAALALLDRWIPPRNTELYSWHRRARNAFGMVGAVSYPYEPVPLPILELMFHQDDDRIKKAVAFVQDADARHENLALISDEWREALKLPAPDTQLIDLCVVLSSSQYKKLAAGIFRRYLSADHGGNSEIAKLLGFMAGNRAELSAYFPSGTSVLSTDDLVMFASLTDSGMFDDAALSALLNGERWMAGYHRGNYGSTHLISVLLRFDETGQRRDVLRVVDHYLDVIDDWIVADPNLGRTSWGPLLVRIGRPEPLAVAARSLLATSVPAFMEQVATAPNAVNATLIETAAILFALSGDDAKATEAYTLLRVAPAYAPITTIEHLQAQRLDLLGEYVGAFEVWTAKGGNNMNELVSAGLAAIRHSDDSDTKRSIARRIVAEMLASGVFQDWTEIDETLLTLGLKRELRSILDRACSIPHLSKSVYDDAFRGYVALDDYAAAVRYVFPHEHKAAWLLDVLDDWRDSIHGSKSQLRDINGRNVFEEGVKGFREIVPEHQFWVMNFAPLLEFLKLNGPMTDRVIVELRVCLALLSDDVARAESLDLLKDMLLGRSRLTLPMKSIQRDVAAAIRDRLRTKS